MFSTKAERIEKFIRELGEGLSTKVMGERPDTLADVIDMATRFDEYFTPSKEALGKKVLLAPPMKFIRPYQFSTDLKNLHISSLGR